MVDQSSDSNPAVLIEDLPYWQKVFGAINWQIPKGAQVQTVPAQVQPVSGQVQLIQPRYNHF